MLTRVAWAKHLLCMNLESRKVTRTAKQQQQPGVANSHRHPAYIVSHIGLEERQHGEAAIDDSSRLPIAALFLHL